MIDFGIETGYASYKLYDGLFSIVLKPDQIIDKQTVESINSKKMELLQEKQFPTMIIIKDDFLFSEKDGFMEFISEKGVQNSSALAIVIQAPLRRILSTFNYSFYKQRVPFRVFSKSSNAKLWLFNYITDLKLEDEELD